MTFRPLLLRLALAMILFAPGLRAQDAPSAAATELTELVTRIQTKLKEGKRSAADLAPELAGFEALTAKYQGQKSNDVAQIAFMRATLFLQVLDDEEKGLALLRQIKTDFPGTAAAANVDRALAAMEQAAQAKNAQSAIVGKPAPELHFTWATRPDLKTLSALKGKVVVIDFWATWCGPCIRSFPEVRELVQHYMGSDVVVLGVTSVQGFVANLEPGRIDTKGNPQKEMELMTTFIKAKEMTWDVAFSEEPVFNPAYGITGIPHMTIIAPDGTVRHNDLHPAAPHAEKTARIDAILKEFGKPVPATKRS